MAVRTRLHEVCAASEGFTFTLARTDRFVDPGVLYLVPQPTQELEKLNHAIRLAFEFELGPRPVFHMTLAGWHPAELDSIEKAFHDCHAGQLPIFAHANALSLYRRQGQVWTKDSDYALGKVELSNRRTKANRWSRRLKS